ncbi:MAG TPA: glycosyltransferase [Pyrinomonadaceae bacterium]|nr:glycosyltransferase [Pyrinomonadaceae bacterium]
MRVLHVIPSVSARSGGPAMAIVPMCRALQRRGVEVVLVTTDAAMRKFEFCQALDYEGVPAIFFPNQLGESFKYSRPLSVWLKQNVRGYELAHIHAVFNHSSVAAARECRKQRVPYVIRPLGTLDPWSMKQKSLRKRLFWSLAGESMLSGAAAVHYTSRAEQTATENLLGVNHGQVIPLGIEAIGDSANDGRGDRSLSPYVLVLSRLHPKKGLDVLIDAFVALAQRAEFDPWRLVIAGDGPTNHVNLLKRKAAAVKERIVFTGWLDGERKEQMLRNASLLVLPSYQENFGLCVMEALARSVPVLLSPHVNLADEIGEANAGWIAPVERQTLTETLATLMSNPDELAKRGSAGKLLSQRYSWERVATELTNLYSQITNGSTGVH